MLVWRMCFNRTLNRVGHAAGPNTSGLHWPLPACMSSQSLSPERTMPMLRWDGTILAMYPAALILQTTSMPLHRLVASLVNPLLSTHTHKLTTSASAMTRDTSRISELRGISDSNKIHIFSPAGYRIVTIQVPLQQASISNLTPLVQWHGHSIIALGWTSTEHLVVVQSDGAAEVYNVRGETKNTFQFCGQVRIQDFSVFCVFCFLFPFLWLFLLCTASCMRSSVPLTAFHASPRPSSKSSSHVAARLPLR